jgi:hypothetical protein
VAFPQPIAQVFQASQAQFADPNMYPVDARGLLFTFIFFTPKRIGESQFYLMAIDDQNGQTLDGGQNYRLNVPANAPVSQYWSATLYDQTTHALIREVSHAGGPPRARDCRSMPTDPWTCTLARQPRQGKRRIGPPPILRHSSKSCFDSMALFHRSSTKLGFCRTSSG